MKSKGTSWIAKAALMLIRAYQRTISPDHGIAGLPWSAGSCRFYPSCSVYTHQAILNEGFFKGALKGFWRIARCHPFSSGGYDPA